MLFGREKRVLCPLFCVFFIVPLPAMEVVPAALKGTPVDGVDPAYYVLFTPSEEPAIVTRIQELISSEKECIQGALFHLDRVDFLGLLLRAFKAGVAITIVLDENNFENFDLSAYPFLHPYKGPEECMHEKFLLFSSSGTAVYGSWNASGHERNPTCDGVFFDCTKRVFDALQAEVRDLLKARRTDVKSDRSPRGDRALIARAIARPTGSPVRVYPHIFFLPFQRGMLIHTVKTLMASDDVRSIQCAMPWFTNPEIATALYKASVRGKTVCLVVDPDSLRKSNVVLRVPGSLVYDGAELMHHKFIIIIFDDRSDKKDVVFHGTWNCSCETCVNRDNMVAHYARSVVLKFVACMDALKAHARRSVTKEVFDIPGIARAFEGKKIYLREHQDRLRWACRDVEEDDLAGPIKNFLSGVCASKRRAPETAGPVSEQTSK